MAEIKRIKAKIILDSKGNPTVFSEVFTDSGKFSASVPSGTSKGRFEARTRDAKSAVKSINGAINKKLAGKDATSQKQIDEWLSRNKSHFGANATLAVSVAVLRAGAKSKRLPLWKWISLIAGIKPKIPYPSVLQIEGGLHARNKLNIQEFMVVFLKNSFGESFLKSKKLYDFLKENLNKRYGRQATALGLEGAFVASAKRTEEALDIIIESARKAGLKNKVKIILDVAASSFFKKGKYLFEGRKKDKKELLDFYAFLLKKYPGIIGIEDPFAEEDWQGWGLMNSKFKKLLVIGDDLTVTNAKRIKLARKRKACNAVIVKPNQIGTVSETIAAVKLAKSYGWKIIVSHRSGETMDDFIADLAVGIGADFIKSGAPSKPERTAKYKRLLKIEKEIHG
ncbi:MAG TPA: phosphopyruvate hydratase [Candidatus Paceibacterota bacterium]|nr:phosphopyruvate hydratase [Candidatus Paceibacterota bacterium]